MRGALFAIAMLIPAGAAGQSPDVTIVGIDGKCSLAIARSKQACQSVIYMMANKTGRISFNVPTELGAIAFSGGSDLQPRLGLYILSVDSILDGRDGTSRRRAARGRCELQGSDDGNFVHRLTCAADTEFGRLELNLQGNGRPVRFLQ